MNKRIPLYLGSLALAANVLVGCGGQAPESSNTAPADKMSDAGGAPAQVTNKLNGAGATFPYPLYSRWFDTYKTAKGVQINYQSVGSGAGIKQLKSKTVDFGASDAPLDDKGLKEMPAPVVQIPTVAGAVVLAYNVEGVTKPLNLSGPVIAQMYLGTITKWNDPKIADLNKGVVLPSTSVVIAHRSDGSGTTNIFTTYLADVSSDWRNKVGAGKSVEWPTGIGGKGSDGVASTVKSTKGAIGYVELAYAKQNKLPYASVVNAAGKAVAPTIEATTAAAEGAVAAVTKDIRAPIANAAGPAVYPISGYTYILVYKKSQDATKGTVFKDFLLWAMEDGQKDAAALDYAPLPKAVAELNKKTIATLE